MSCGPIINIITVNTPIYSSFAGGLVMVLFLFLFFFVAVVFFFIKSQCCLGSSRHVQIFRLSNIGVFDLNFESNCSILFSGVYCLPSELI